jgi:hypothetical protein
VRALPVGCVFVLRQLAMEIGMDRLTKMAGLDSVTPAAPKLGMKTVGCLDRWMGRVGTGRDGTGWDGMGWDGMGWMNEWYPCVRIHVSLAAAPTSVDRQSDRRSCPVAGPCGPVPCLTVLTEYP